MDHREQSHSPEFDKPISILDLPPYENPWAEEYDELIRSIDKPDIEQRYKETPVGYVWYHVYKKGLGEEQITELVPVFQEGLADQVLVDLGGGPKSLMLDFAQRSGAKEYINVDRYEPGLA